MTKRLYGDRFACVDCDAIFGRRGDTGGIPLYCDACRKARHLVAVKRWQARNREAHLAAHAASERRRRRERDGLPMDHVY